MHAWRRVKTHRNSLWPHVFFSTACSCASVGCPAAAASSSAMAWVGVSCSRLRLLLLLVVICGGERRSSSFAPPRAPAAAALLAIIRSCPCRLCVSVRRNWVGQGLARVEMKEAATQRLDRPLGMSEDDAPSSATQCDSVGQPTVPFARPQSWNLIVPTHAAGEWCWCDLCRSAWDGHDKHHWRAVVRLFDGARREIAPTTDGPYSIRVLCA